jgi:hypothetical protein
VSWLGRTVTTFKADNVNAMTRDIVSEILVQKSLTDPDVLRKVLAHEVCHHVANWKLVANKSFKDAQDAEAAEPEHGQSWWDEVAKINARYGADFVNEQQEYNGDSGQTFYVLLRNVGDFITWCWAVRPSPAQRRFIENWVRDGAKLILSRDSELASPRARMGQGWLRMTSPEGRAKLQKLWEQEPATKLVDAKQAKAIEVPEAFCSEVLDTWVLPYLKRYVAGVSPDKWKEEVSKDEALWSWDISPLVVKYLPKLATLTSNPVTLEVGFSAKSSFPATRVVDAWSDARTSTVRILMAFLPSLSDFPKEMHEDLKQVFVHEMAHLLQAVYQGADAYNARMLQLKPRTNPNAINHNYEVKALSSELCATYADHLKNDPGLSVEDFLATQWQWPQIKRRMDLRGQQTILKDLAHVKSSGPKTSAARGEDGAGDLNALPKRVTAVNPAAAKYLTWYHGSVRPRNEWTLENVGKKDAADKEGPGLYFTTSLEDAMAYGDYVAEVKLNLLKSRTVPLTGRVNEMFIRRLIKKAPDAAYSLMNWAENPNVALTQAARAIVEYSEGPHDAYQSVYADFYYGHPQEFFKALWMFDGVVVPRANGVLHAIIYRPEIIKTIRQMKRDEVLAELEAEEKQSQPQPNKTGAAEKTDKEAAPQAAPPPNPPAQVQMQQAPSPAEYWYMRVHGPELERRFGLVPRILLHLIEKESKGDPYAQNSRGAKGLFQIMPATQSGFDGNPFDPLEAAAYVAETLSKNVKQFGSYEKALAAWNWGRGNLFRKGLHQAPPETRDFLQFFKQKGIV